MYRRVIELCDTPANRQEPPGTARNSRLRRMRRVHMKCARTAVIGTRDRGPYYRRPAWWLHSSGVGALDGLRPPCRSTLAIRRHQLVPLCSSLSGRNLGQPVDLCRWTERCILRAHHGPADLLACKSHIPECEFQDGFNGTKAGGVTALRKFDLRSRGTHSVVASSH
jgi:hypothetical protein